MFKVNSLSFPTLTVAVSPPFTTLPFPPLDSSAPSRTLTVTVTVPSFPAATSVIVQVTNPPPFVNVLAPVHVPLFEALTNCTFASSLSVIVTDAVADL